MHGVLERSENIVEVRLNKNRIGPFGAAALGRALAVNKSIKIMQLR